MLSFPVVQWSDRCNVTSIILEEKVNGIIFVLVQWIVLGILVLCTYISECFDAVYLWD